MVPTQIVVQRLQCIPPKRHPGPPQLRHRRQRRTLQKPRLVQQPLGHPLVKRPIQLGQQLHVVRSVIQLTNSQVATPVTPLLLLRYIQLQVTLYNVLQPVLNIRQPISQDAAGQHTTQHVSCRIHLVLLQPAQVEHSIVRQPVPLGRKELLYILPLVILKIPAVNDHRHPV